jgi:hypothetical protein
VVTVEVLRIRREHLEVAVGDIRALAQVVLVDQGKLRDSRTT